MVRITSVVATFCLALLLPALADAQGSNDRTVGPAARLTARPLAATMYAAVPGTPSVVQSCRVEDVPPGPEPDDPRWRWRLRAFHHLDCVAALIDAALRDAKPRDNEAPRDVPMSRDDLERIRTLAWWARDAAARIGQ